MSKLFLASNFYTVSSMVATLLHDEQKDKKILFITTAAEAEEGDKSWLNDDRDSLKKMGFEVIDYTITGKNQSDFATDFKDIHYVLISGGNVFYLLEKAQQSTFISFINEYIKSDENVYFGSSAGAAITGLDIFPLKMLDDPQKAPNLQGYIGFGFIDICLLPHWGSENFKRKYLGDALAQAYSEKYKLILLTNNQFLYVEADGSYSLLEI